MYNKIKLAERSFSMKKAIVYILFVCLSTLGFVHI